MNYLENYLEGSEYREKAINIFLAITSSSSIAGWVIWQKAALVWAIIIAGSQVVTAVKPFLPYQSRLKLLGGLIHDFGEIVLYAERMWFDVSEGKLTEEEIHNLQFELKERKSKALKKHVGNTTLPQKQKLLVKAQNSADIYFDNFYPP